MGASQCVQNITELCDLNLSLLEGWLENIFLTPPPLPAVVTGGCHHLDIEGLGHGAVHIGADGDHLERKNEF